MIIRKKGTTDKQYIKDLHSKIVELSEVNHNNLKQIVELEERHKVVHVDRYNKLLKRYLSVVQTLKNYNLWTGD